MRHFLAAILPPLPPPLVPPPTTCRLARSVCRRYFAPLPSHGVAISLTVDPNGIVSVQGSVAALFINAGDAPRSVSIHLSELNITASAAVVTGNQNLHLLSSSSPPRYPLSRQMN